MTVSRCPRCGEPARIAIIKRARVRCVLKADGSIGRVLSASKEASPITAYECGGGHTWEKEKQ